MSAEAKQTLKEAASLLERTGWTQGQMARDACDESVNPDAGNACRFCAAGAIWHETGRRDADQYDSAIIAFAEHLRNLGEVDLVDDGCGYLSYTDRCEAAVTRWNDRHDIHRIIVVTQMRAAADRQPAANG